MDIRSRIKIILLAVSAAVLGTSPASTEAVTVQSEDLATCRVSGISITLVPGVSTTYQRGTFTTHGQPGKVECEGLLRGHQVTGSGTFSEEGSFEGDCSGGQGLSTISITLPTSDGPVTLRIPVTFTFKPGFGWKTSEVFLGKLVFQYHPTKGDCLTTPVTEFQAAAQAVIRT